MNADGTASPSATCLPLRRLARPHHGESRCRSSLSADKARGQRCLITKVTRTDGTGSLPGRH